ncbi:MAG: hypothetical protein JW812_03600, partial [Alphaproteobacteria bacterium]|nr:hypothetical protein [Alphaproteobacteria bacterium]
MACKFLSVRHTHMKLFINRKKENRMNKEELLKKFEKAKATRRPWESIWEECYHYGLPHGSAFHENQKIKSDLFDSTAS